MATATAQPVMVERLPRSRSLRLPPWEKLTPLLLITPSVILIAVFVYGFIGATMRTSLVRWNSALPDYTFVGLHNYQRLFQLDRFQADLVNTLHFTAIFLAGCIVLGLGAAVLLDQRPRGSMALMSGSSSGGSRSRCCVASRCRRSSSWGTSR